MPYYQCPKCSGRDTYEGTELVSGSTGGDAVIGPENDLGFSPVMKTGVKKTIDQVTVVKCKACDIILGDKDIQFSQTELEAQKEKQKKEEEASDEEWGRGCALVFAVLMFGLGCFFATSLTVKQFLPDWARYVAIVLVGLVGIVFSAALWVSGGESTEEDQTEPEHYTEAELEAQKEEQKKRKKLQPKNGG